MERTSKNRPLFYSAQVPILQNKVYLDENKAKNAQPGCLNIVQNIETDFAYNAEFQENLIQYDQDYDNSVPSDAFMKYYDEIADYLVKNYDLRNGIVIDIGCGKGTFLSRLANRHPYIKGMGIDPSYDGPLTSFNDRLQFKKEHFSQEHLKNVENIAIVLCRHVLEHIPSPIDFLKLIFKPLHTFHDIPLFIEVPDLSWIIINNAFWDFCYEHVNYFNHKSLNDCITQAGGNVINISPSFGDQYIWAEAILNSTNKNNRMLADEKSNSLLTDYRKNGLDFKEYLELVISRVKKISSTKEIVIWGMATKGVMYSLHLINSGIAISHCIDINERKQGKFSPLSGLKIQSPDKLKQGKEYAIICMNPNYAMEIESQCIELGLNILTLTPDAKII